VTFQFPFGERDREEETKESNQRSTLYPRPRLCNDEDGHGFHEEKIRKRK
jgi:hypothetical protein